MPDLQDTLMRAGGEARLTALANEAAAITAVHDDLATFARALFRRVLKIGSGGHTRGSGKGAHAKTSKARLHADLTADLQTARALRAAPKALRTDAAGRTYTKPRRPMSPQQKDRMRKVMKARWKAAKLAGRTLQDGFTSQDALKALAAKAAQKPAGNGATAPS